MKMKRWWDGGNPFGIKCGKVQGCCAADAACSILYDCDCGIQRQRGAKNVRSKGF